MLCMVCFSRMWVGENNQGSLWRFEAMCVFQGWHGSVSTMGYVAAKFSFRCPAFPDFTSLCREKFHPVLNTDFFNLH